MFAWGCVSWRTTSRRVFISLACELLAQKASRLVLTVRGGVILKLAGTAVAGGRKIPWPQLRVCRCFARAGSWELGNYTNRKFYHQSPATG